MMNSVELKKQPRSRYYYHTTMLFDVDNTNEMSAEPAQEFTAMAAVPGDIIEELTIAQGRNKLLSRDSFHMLVFACFCMGMLFFYIAYTHKTNLKDGGHFYLPRPN